jgi:hypothetical protein
MFYRSYLRGADLAGKACQVEILTCKQVTVRPNPQSPEVVKWCLWVKGLPADLPNGILLGTTGAQQLREILGDVDSEQLTGKRVEIFPITLKVAGSQKVAIRFRKAGGQP